MSPEIFFKICIIILIYILKEINSDFQEANDKEIEVVTIEPRIVGGYRPNDSPLTKYIVSIRQQTETERSFGYTHFCAGTIIAANKILTAAHCIFRNGKISSASSFKVVAKTPVRLNKNSRTQEINIKRIIGHAQYSDSTLFHDIALLILSENILLDSKFAAKISLPQKNYEAEKMCSVIGWGKLYMHGPLANELVHVDLHLHSRKYCRRRYPNFSGKKICASNIYDKGKDSCVGDSGGPLICNDVIAGIVSYGYGCASGEAGIYTNVFKYIDWINKYSGQDNHKPILIMIVLSCFLNGYFT
ncbi:chymotrypsin-2-like [Lucilia cuprina]|uniref:chymotrypsin-2-like n=1 Tax=Lucilia cuprina TaxID=7375 RepID=UPI001F053214|nr:chymotrypsin-2-like [Lucilia cuprina]